jgi:hypothetical protein
VTVALSLDVVPSREVRALEVDLLSVFALSTLLGMAQGKPTRHYAYWHLNKATSVLISFRAYRCFIWLILGRRAAPRTTLTH